MPFTLTSVFQITSIAPRPNNTKRVFYANVQIEEDDWISAMLTAFDDVLPNDLNVGDYIFATGKAAWVNSELQVSNLTTNIC